MHHFTMLSTWIKMCGQAVDFEAYHIFFSTRSFFFLSKKEIFFNFVKELRFMLLTIFHLNIVLML